MKTASEFIAFFEAIPEEKWCTGTYHDGDRHCAYGHLIIADLENHSEDSEQFGLLMGFNRYSVSSVNDGDCRSFTQPTPKQRILAALREIEGKA